MEYKQIVKIAKKREFVYWTYSRLIERLFFNKENKKVYAYSMFTKGHVIREKESAYNCRYITQKEFDKWKKLPWPTETPKQYGFRHAKPPSQ